METFLPGEKIQSNPEGERKEKRRSGTKNVGYGGQRGGTETGERRAWKVRHRRKP